MANITAELRTAALRRGIVLQPAGDPAPENLRMAASIELANLGFFANVDALAGMSIDALTAMLKDARTVMGADRNWTPIYPGFPQQVEELSTLTLLWEQILHYWSGGTLLPDYPTVAREGLPLEDMMRNVREVKVLPVDSGVMALLKELVTDPVALSQDDSALLREGFKLVAKTSSNGIVDLLRNGEKLVELAKQHKNGENLQHLTVAAVETGAFSSASLLELLLPSCFNVDEVLRVVLAVASAPSDEKWTGNYKLAVDTLADRHSRAVRMSKLSRPARRLVVARLGELTSGFKADRLVGRQDLWRNVLRAVHPYDFKLTDEQRRAVDIVHSNMEYRTLNSLVEEAMETGDASAAVALLAEHQPGNLLRRVVAILRLVKTDAQARELADALKAVGVKSQLTTLISAYNGVLSANDTNARVNRVAGLTNTMLERKEVAKVDEAHLSLALEGIRAALSAVLKSKPAPVGPVGVRSSLAVPLVRRDAATADRVLDRGQEMAPAGEGDILRIFGHWNNNQSSSGYMDIGVVILDEKFEKLAVSTWNAWNQSRSWSTYSGDKLVEPGDDAAEFIDVKLKKLKAEYPGARWAAMTVQSWTGWPMANVDFIAGAMLRSNGEKGEVFDARTVATAFKPTTESTQAVPFAVNLETGMLVWIDSSNGSTGSHLSSTDDASIGAIVYDELARPRLTMGELAALWAGAHDAETTGDEVDRETVLALLG